MSRNRVFKTWPWLRRFVWVRADKAAVPDSMTSSVPDPVRKNDGDHCAKPKAPQLAVPRGISRESVHSNSCC